MNPIAQQIRTWFDTADPTAEDGYAKLDEARTRGLITRDEYLDLLDVVLDGDNDLAALRRSVEKNLRALEAPAFALG